MTNEPASENTSGRLRAESDVLMAHLAKLQELEEMKRTVPPADPRFVALAVEVEQTAEALLKEARAQTELGDAAHVQGVETPIVQIPQNLSAYELISGWREAERKLADTASDSAEARSLRTLIDAYRRAYQDVFDRKPGSN